VLLPVTTLIDGRAMLTERHLQAAWGFTAAEARLALCLADGQSVRAAAKALGITYETARSRLKAIFQKTRTHRQGELIALMARAAADRLSRTELRNVPKNLQRPPPNGG